MNIKFLLSNAPVSFLLITGEIYEKNNSTSYSFQEYLLILLVDLSICLILKKIILCDKIKIYS